MMLKSSVTFIFVSGVKFSAFQKLEAKFQK